MTPRTVAALAALLAAGVTAGAQTLPPAPAPPPPQLPWLQAVSVNPLGIVAGVFSADYEVALRTPGVTAGVGGTIANGSFLFNDNNHRWLEGRVMYYPGEVSLRGLAAGVTLGAHRAVARGADSTGGHRSDAGVTLGILGTYNYLVGRQQRLVLGVGAGAKRVLKDVGGGSPLNQVYPDGRVLVGFAF